MKFNNIKELAIYLDKPYYVLEESKLRDNLEILDMVQRESGAKILLALKGYAFWSSFELVSKYLCGVTASGIYEAKLGFEEFRRFNSSAEISVFSPGFKKAEVEEISTFANHIIFNSFNQFQSFKNIALTHDVEIGIRVNPLYSEVMPEIYNPCVSGSRLGVAPNEFYKNINNAILKEISGIHFHTHCEQNSDALQRTLKCIENHFGAYIKNMKWINFGGGHHITRKDYDIDLLINLIRDFKARYNDIDVYLEPGEAIGWQCGVLIGEVVDIVRNDIDIAILDLSAAAHMPDCLEMPYTPQILGANIAKVKQDSTKKNFYRLGAPSCLAGDVIGDYIFDEALKVGDKIIIEDMIHYTIVKNNTFNGIPLPSLGILKENGDFVSVREFDYKNYKYRNS